MVAIRIPDTEKRSVQELTAAHRGRDRRHVRRHVPAFVIVAGPGEDGIPVVGDGTITEPGRYAVICAIPSAPTRRAVAEAMQTAELGARRTSVTARRTSPNGMFAELNVTA